MAQAKAYKPGDIVHLKSGGPKMTVKEYDYDGRSILCTWFSGSKLSEAAFEPDTIEPFAESVQNKSGK